MDVVVVVEELLQVVERQVVLDVALVVAMVVLVQTLEWLDRGGMVLLVVV